MSYREQAHDTPSDEEQVPMSTTAWWPLLALGVLLGVGGLGASIRTRQAVPLQPQPKALAEQKVTVVRQEAYVTDFARSLEKPVNHQRVSLEWQRCTLPELPADFFESQQRLINLLKSQSSTLPDSMDRGAPASSAEHWADSWTPEVPDSFP